AVGRCGYHCAALDARGLVARHVVIEIAGEGVHFSCAYGVADLDHLGVHEADHLPLVVLPVDRHAEKRIARGRSSEYTSTPPILAAERTRNCLRRMGGRLAQEKIPR